MPVIRPISDLRNNFAEISELCHKEGEPVFITKNGEGDMVVMSLAKYEQQQATLTLYAKLMESQEQERSGAPLMEHEEVMGRLRERLNGKTKN